MSEGGPVRARQGDPVALVTGAARGLGRATAVELGRRGYRVLALDICSQIETVPYPMGSLADLEETRALVREAGTACLAQVADVRSRTEVEAGVRLLMEEWGRLDVVVANAGVAQGLDSEDTTTPDQQWADYLAVNLTGAWNTIVATRDELVATSSASAHDTSVVVVSSSSGLKGMSRGDARSDAYTAAKHGLVGLVRAYALELGPLGVRVNSVHPSAMATPMVENDAMAAWVQANLPRVSGGFGNAMHRSRMEPRQVADAVAWLAGPAAGAVTGIAMPVDYGFSVT